MDLRDLADIWATHGSPYITRPTFELRGRKFGGQPDLMGVVNLSSGSWYRESVVVGTESALLRGRRLHIEGAALIDLGAESTILDTARANAEEQKRMLLPVVRGLEEDGILVSAETYNSDVAVACLDAGAAVINLTGRRASDAIYDAAAANDAGVIICFVEGADVRSVADRNLAEDPVPQLYEYFAREIERATERGVRAIWIDPGLGFYYKNLSDSDVRIRFQLENLLHSFRLLKLGWPVCNALPHAFEHFHEEVRSAESLFGVFALLGGTSLLRTHEVPKLRAVIGTLSTWDHKSDAV